MIYGSIHCLKYQKNELFLSGKGSNSGVFFLPYGLLRESFLKKGIELNTPDLNKGKKVSFELHVNAQTRRPQSRAYVYLFENPLIRPLNSDISVLNQYAKWFTWYDELSSSPQFIKLFYPNKINSDSWNNFEQRSKFLVLVARNKDLNILDSRSLIPLRQEIIKWYEMNATNDFYLYGRGWDQPFAVAGRWGKLFGQLQKIKSLLITSRTPLKTWKGPIENKIQLLQQAKFCIAHENCRNLSGYITEKIFHCFRAGCVPIYIGPKEIYEFIPPECFIDGRLFNTPQEMDNFLRSIDKEIYQKYQDAIRQFLLSEKAKPFSEEYFVEKIVNTIFNDLSAT